MKEPEKERTIEVSFGFRRLLLQCLEAEDKAYEGTPEDGRGPILYTPSGTKLYFKAVKGINFPPMSFEAEK